MSPESNAGSAEKPMSLQQLLDEPKGKTTYHPGEAFLLHVFWEAPNMAAADRVLSALQRCAEATHRDTPCVPTYYFHRSSLDADLVSDGPKTVGQHTQLMDAIKKLKVGVPRPAVAADLARRQIDPNLLDANPSDPLPEAMQERPVMLEFTELYLDQRSFYEHAGSRDYLEAYGEVLKPGLMNRQVTIRMGAPTAEIVDKILAPMLKEKVEPIPGGCTLWRQPDAKDPADGTLISLSVPGTVERATQNMPTILLEESSTCLAFPHPLKSDRVRVICFLTALPDAEMLVSLSVGLQPMGIEVYCTEAQEGRMAGVLRLASLGNLATINTTGSGYVIHDKAHEIHEVS